MNPEVIRSVENPYSKQGGIAILRGSLAPEGAVVKQSAVAPEMMCRDVTARVFESEEDAMCNGKSSVDRWSVRVCRQNCTGAQKRGGSIMAAQGQSQGNPPQTDV